MWEARRSAACYGDSSEADPLALCVVGAVVVEAGDLKDGPLVQAVHPCGRIASGMCGNWAERIARHSSASSRIQSVGSLPHATPPSPGPAPMGKRLEGSSLEKFLRWDSQCPTAQRHSVDIAHVHRGPEAAGSSAI